MTDSPAPIAPCPSAGYGDTAALNDIHAVLTTPSPLTAEDALQAVAGFVARTGRPMFPSRVITAVMEDDPFGMPVARIDAEGTTILITPALNATGLLIHVTPRDQAEEDALVIDVNGKTVSTRVAPRPATGSSTQ